ncbi:hypothetical protein WISP_48606 [Willisornis vidua]|uniref:Uncharacterized protein n=1 Tax=Willisornis vidua TaxID=1566151 RepID=A0ABQ9DEE7_9PASS|nr:hypothetical protein WISP_48606 [Willisornis vidua]
MRAGLRKPMESVRAHGWDSSCLLELMEAEALVWCQASPQLPVLLNPAKTVQLEIWGHDGISLKHFSSQCKRIPQWMDQLAAVPGCTALRDLMIMVIAATGNKFQETNFSITAASNCAGFCKTYLHIFLVSVKKESIMKALSGQENII